VHHRTHADADDILAPYMPDQQGRTPSSNTSIQICNTHALTHTQCTTKASPRRQATTICTEEPTEACSSSSNNNSNRFIAVPCSIAAAWRRKWIVGTAICGHRRRTARTHATPNQLNPATTT
jgi:hypothetical protein